MIGHKKRDVECVMNFPHFEEMMLICDEGKDFNNGEGFFSFESEFQVGDRAFQVSGF